MEDEIVVRLVAVTWRGEFLAQDLRDGFLVPVGHTGFTRINSLTVTPDDRVLCVAQQDGGAHPVLIEIDPSTGCGAVVCTLDRLVDVRALAAGPDGTLYAMLASDLKPGANWLAELNPTNGHVAVLKSYAGTRMQGMEFCPHGHLFAYTNGAPNSDRGPAIVTFYPEHDWAADAVQEISETRMVQSLAFDGCDLGHVVWVENGPLNAEPAPIVEMPFDSDADAITFGKVICNPIGMDVRGIGFLGARRWWERYQSECEVCDTPDEPEMESTP